MEHGLVDCYLEKDAFFSTKNNEFCLFHLKKWDPVNIT